MAAADPLRIVVSPFVKAISLVTPGAQGFNGTIHESVVFEHPGKFAVPITQPIRLLNQGCIKGGGDSGGSELLHHSQRHHAQALDAPPVIQDLNQAEWKQITSRGLECPVNVRNCQSKAYRTSIDLAHE